MALLRAELGLLRRNLAAFLTRPYGGMEVELLILISETGQAVFLLTSPETAANTRAFQDFFWLGIPSWYIAIPFVFAGFTSFSGIILFFLHRKICAPLRWAGSVMSIFIWVWMGTKTGIVLEWDLGYIVICYAFAVWSVRISAAAWNRWEPWRPWHRAL